MRSSGLPTPSESVLRKLRGHWSQPMTCGRMLWNLRRFLRTRQSSRPSSTTCRRHLDPPSTRPGRASKASVMKRRSGGSLTGANLASPDAQTPVAAYQPSRVYASSALFPQAAFRPYQPGMLVLPLCVKLSSSGGATLRATPGGRRHSVVSAGQHTWTMATLSPVSVKGPLKAPGKHGWHTECFVQNSSPVDKVVEGSGH